MTDTVASLSVRIGADTSDARAKLQDLERLGNAFGRSITNAFEDAVFSGDGLGQTLRSLALDLSKLALRSAVEPFSNAIGGGQLGLAGEAGPEAILPLTRGSDGRLGVRAQSGGGNIAITMNISAQDAESFRRSETQIGAMLVRAVNRGQRNL